MIVLVKIQSVGEMFGKICLKAIRGDHKETDRTWRKKGGE